jgi:glycosyltransferase involved in cell wall biosynthesis
MERLSERLHHPFDADCQISGCQDGLAEGLYSPLAPSKIRGGGELVAVQYARRDEMDQLVGQPSRTKTIFYGVPGLKNESRYNGREKKRREIGMASNDFLVIGVGRLVEQKRPFEFLRIAKELQIRVPSVRFLWVGDGELADEWKTAIARDGLAHVISHTGWREDVTPYLLAGDLLLHVAKYDGLPFAIIEAIAAGLPCGATRDLAREIPMLGVGATLPADDVDHLCTRNSGCRCACLYRRKRFEAVQPDAVCEQYGGKIRNTIYRHDPGDAGPFNVRLENRYSLCLRRCLT